MTSQKGFAHAILIIGLFVAILGALGFIFWQNFIYKEPVAINTEVTVSTNTPTNTENTRKESPISTKGIKAYEGKEANAGNFQIKVPNGWSVSIGQNSGYAGSNLAVFAGPNELSKLKYDSTKEPSIYPHAGLGWDGYTEHFYVVSQEPDSSRDMSKYSSREFELEDGTVGKRYVNSLKKQDQGDFYSFSQDADSYIDYIYEFEKNGIVVRAYIAMYSNSKFDLDLAEKIIGLIEII